MQNIIIRAVHERSNWVNALYAQLPGAIIIWDRKRDPMETFVRSLERVGEEPCLQVEDDAILAPNFLERAQQEIDRHPESIVQFFSMRPDDLTIGSRWDDHFIGGVCFYLPAGYARMLVDYAPRWPKRASNPTALDVMVKHWMRKERGNERYWIVVPNLADHRVGVSSVDPKRPRDRQSLTFEKIP